MTDILLVAVDHDLVNRVAAVGDHRVVSIDRYTVHGGKHAGPSTEPDFRPDLIFVGSGLPTEQAIDYAAVVIGDHPEIAVILVIDKPDKDIDLRAMTAGIHLVINEQISDSDLAVLIDSSGMSVTAPPTAEAVAEPSSVVVPEPVEAVIKPVVKRSARRSARQVAKSGAQAVAKPAPSQDKTYPHQVIVVASPKGGVGKTTMAINVAALLAEAAPGEVVVLDLDLQFGDVAATLDLTPAYTITDAFASGADDSMRLRTLLVPHDAGFYVLCGSDDPAENGRVTGDQIRKLVHHYSSSFRFVVIDTSAGLHEETLASLEEATDVILVAALDVATLRAVHREVEVLAELSLLPPRRHVVLNRADRRSGLSERDAERIIGLPIDAVIPASERVPMAANRGELVIASRKRNPVLRHLKDVARTVIDLGSPKGTLA